MSTSLKHYVRNMQIEENILLYNFFTRDEIRYLFIQLSMFLCVESNVIECHSHSN